VQEVIRLAIAAALGGGILGAACLGRTLFRRKLAGHRSAAADDLVSQYDLPAGEPGILYFSGDRCVQCVALQEPALARLAKLQPVNVRKLRAVAEPELTRRFNILTVPSTVVIGADHRVRGVNVGFADEKTLLEQLA
jgi:hypothetical protein